MRDGRPMKIIRFCNHFASHGTLEESGEAAKQRFIDSGEMPSSFEINAQFIEGR